MAPELVGVLLESVEEELEDDSELLVAGLEDQPNK